MTHHPRRPKLARSSLCVALVVGPLVLPFKANLNALTLETTLESLLIEEQESAHQYRMATSKEPADVEMEEEGTTPCPMPNQYFSQLPDNESESNLDDEHFQTPLAVLRKKGARNVVMDSDDMFEGKGPVAVNQDQSEMKGKKAIQKVGCLLKTQLQNLITPCSVFRNKWQQLLLRIYGMTAIITHLGVMKRCQLQCKVGTMARQLPMFKLSMNPSLRT